MVAKTEDSPQNCWHTRPIYMIHSETEFEQLHLDQIHTYIECELWGEPLKMHILFLAKFHTY